MTVAGQPLQLRGGNTIVGAFCQERAPASLGLGKIAALGGEHGEVAPGEVSVDPLIDAAKLVGRLQARNPKPTALGLSRFAAMARNVSGLERQMTKDAGIRSPDSIRSFIDRHATSSPTCRP
jgi:hypothetical protein